MNHILTYKLNMKSFYRKKFYFISIVFFLLGNIIYGQSVYYPDRDRWEHNSPAEAGFDKVKLQEAVDFALDNEYSGDRDLRVAILESFGYEPY
ncbi:MAG TPA: hypothetical protein DEQ09_13255, partial [Bacteroidales bacterium]|nr:hypothetical protein [Bacteroidales bacterium]